MIRTIIKLKVAPGREREFEEMFRAQRVLALARGVAGLRTGELLRPSKVGDPYVVIATWDSAADYAVWVNSPLRRQTNSAAPIWEPVAPADLFEIVDSLELRAGE